MVIGKHINRQCSCWREPEEWLCDYCSATGGTNVVVDRWEPRFLAVGRPSGQPVLASLPFLLSDPPGGHQEP